MKVYLYFNEMDNLIKKMCCKGCCKCWKNQNVGCSNDAKITIHKFHKFLWVYITFPEVLNLKIVTLVNKSAHFYNILGFKLYVVRDLFPRQDLFPSYLFSRRQFNAIVIFRLKSISDLDSGSLPRFFGEFIYMKLKSWCRNNDWT